MVSRWWSDTRSMPACHSLADAFPREMRRQLWIVLQTQCQTSISQAQLHPSVLALCLLWTSSMPARMCRRCLPLNWLQWQNTVGIHLVGKMLTHSCSCPRLLIIFWLFTLADDLLLWRNGSCHPKLIFRLLENRWNQHLRSYGRLLKSFSVLSLSMAARSLPWSAPKGNWLFTNVGVGWVASLMKPYLALISQKVIYGSRISDVPWSWSLYRSDCYSSGLYLIGPFVLEFELGFLGLPLCLK